MEAIKAWAMTLCFAALAAGLANVIAPKGNLEKVYKFAVSLFFLCCVLAPVFTLRGVRAEIRVPEVSAGQNGGFASTVEQQKIQAAEQSVEEQIRGVCRSQGVTPRQVNVTAQTDHSGAITSFAAEVILSGADMPKKSGLAAAVKETLGMDITVKEGGTGG